MHEVLFLKSGWEIFARSMLNYQHISGHHFPKHKLVEVDASFQYHKNSTFFKLVLHLLVERFLWMVN